MANEDLTDEQKALATPAVECVNAQVKDGNYDSTSLSLQERIEMNFDFKNLKGKDVANMYAEVSFVDGLGESQNVTLSGDSLIKRGTSGVRVKVTETVLSDAFQLITVTLYVDGEAFSTVTDSVESYVNRYVAAYGDETGLFGNIMKFAASAKAYFS